MSEYRQILVATDLHNDAFPVVKKAVKIAKRSNASLIILTVVPDVPFYMASGLNSIPSIEAQFESRYRQRLALLKMEVDMPAEYIVLRGSAKMEILKLALKKAADLIVIGSHGANGVQRLLGSTSIAVLHRAKADVLLVRAKTRAEIKKRAKSIARLSKKKAKAE